MARLRERERLRAFGAALAEALATRGCTQRELGHALGGITQSAISAWRSGLAEPGTETVFAIERTLGLPGGHLSRHLGYVPPASAEAAAGTVAAVENDPLLTDDERRALLAVYLELVRGRRATSVRHGR